MKIIGVMAAMAKIKRARRIAHRSGIALKQRAALAAKKWRGIV
jgi:hypothetical protein